MGNIDKSLLHRHCHKITYLGKRKYVIASYIYTDPSSKIPEITKFIIPDLEESYKAGDVIDITQFTHCEKNSRYIEGGQVQLYVNETLLGSYDASDVEVIVREPVSYVVKDTDTELVFKLQGVSVSGVEFNKILDPIPVKSSGFLYRAVNDFEGYDHGVLDAQGAFDRMEEDEFISGSIYEFILDTESYIWICTKQEIEIKDSWGFDYTEEYYRGKHEITVNGNRMEYHFYRSDLLSSGQFIFVFNLKQGGDI